MGEARRFDGESAAPSRHVREAGGFEPIDQTEAPIDRSIQILLEVSESIAAAGEVTKALHKLAGLALRATGSDRCAILTPDPSGPVRLLPSAGASRVDKDGRRLWRKFQSMDPIEIGSDWQRRAILYPAQAVTLEDAQASPLIPDQWKAEWGSKSVAFASVRADGEVYGLLAVDYVEKSHSFTTKEAELLDAIAAAAGVALRGARLVERLEASIAKERRLAAANEALRRLADAVVRSSDLRSVLAALNNSVFRQVGVTFHRVAFGDPALASLLRVRTTTEADASVLKLWRGGANADPRFIDGEIIAPIHVGGRVAGLLWLRPLDEFRPAMLEFAAAVAGGLGNVAHKAKLRHAADRRARDLEIGIERDRIAHDLHDTVGQTFFGIGLSLQNLLADVQDPELRQRIARLRELASASLIEVRSAVYSLSALNIRSRGLLASIKDLTTQFRDSAGITAELRVDKALPLLSDQVEEALYKVIHEALGNVERYGRATGVVVSLGRERGAVELSIRDDGVGIDQRLVADWRSGPHLGVRTMARAIERVGGTFTITPTQPRGLHIRAVVPAQAGADGPPIGGR